MPEGPSYNSILSNLLHFILHLCKLKLVCFSSSILQLRHKRFVSCLPGWTCSQELLTQEKAVLLQARSCQELGYLFIACWGVLAFHMFTTRRLCITSCTSRTKSYTWPVMLTHSLLISLLHTTRCDFIFFNLLK